MGTEVIEPNRIWPRRGTAVLLAALAFSASLFLNLGTSHSLTAFIPMRAENPTRFFPPASEISGIQN